VDKQRGRLKTKLAFSDDLLSLLRIIQVYGLSQLFKYKTSIRHKIY